MSSIGWNHHVTCITGLWISPGEESGGNFYLFLDIKGVADVCPRHAWPILSSRIHIHRWYQADHAIQPYPLTNSINKLKMALTPANNLAYY
jgi:hypothetical protein